ncbi:hypothetical protein [Musicola paradisiaca]|uniref:hypothetical protein n=1 Tax=Musicola paradisiaca TaxID=69223 RepID=UPI001292DA3D|nr:hypothetical protein [Musicola paradisiaca]
MNKLLALIMILNPVCHRCRRSILDRDDSAEIRQASQASALLRGWRQRENAVLAELSAGHQPHTVTVECIFQITRHGNSDTDMQKIETDNLLIHLKLRLPSPKSVIIMVIKDQ